MLFSILVSSATTLGLARRNSYLYVIDDPPLFCHHEQEREGGEEEEKGRRGCLALVRGGFDLPPSHLINDAVCSLDVLFERISSPQLVSVSFHQFGDDAGFT